MSADVGRIIVGGPGIPAGDGDPAVVTAEGAPMTFVSDLMTRLLEHRRSARAPVWLFRARLGVVFGSRMILLEHRGRTTGARRYAVLEVVGHPAPSRYLVVSGFGERVGHSITLGVRFRSVWSGSLGSQRRIQPPPCAPCDSKPPQATMRPSGNCLGVSVFRWVRNIL